MQKDREAVFDKARRTTPYFTINLSSENRLLGNWSLKDPIIVELSAPRIANSFRNLFSDSINKFMLISKRNEFQYINLLVYFTQPGSCPSNCPDILFSKIEEICCSAYSCSFSCFLGIGGQNGPLLGNGDRFFQKTSKFAQSPGIAANGLKPRVSAAYKKCYTLYNKKGAKMASVWKVLYIVIHCITKSKNWCGKVVHQF